MKIAVLGNDTLAKAVAECCARHFTVTPRVEPDTDLVWVCHDTPIGADDSPDAEFVLERIREVAWAGCRVPVLISSQMPVGSTARIEGEFPEIFFAYSPENIRVASAVADFTHQARVVVGRRSDRHDDLFTEVFERFTANILFTDPETAEMAKTALNCYLAMSISFINEIARICAVVGADASTVSVALRTDARVSPKAPLRPGAPFGGGHLERELFNVNQIATAKGVRVPILAHINESNALAANRP